MRAPLHIVLILCLFAIIVPWCVGTRNLDFMEQPTTEELASISEAWAENQSDITAPTDYDPKAEQKALKKKDDDTHAQLIRNAKKNLSTSPSLSEYGSLANQGSGAIISLAEHLETEAYPLQALLAWERVLDTTKPTTEERVKALKAMERIKATLPPWNADPSADIKLILHVGTSAKDTTTLTESLSKIAKTISQASSYIVNIDTKITKQVKDAQPVTIAPISVWFSSAQDQSIETSAISITANLENPELLKKQLELAVYQTLQMRLKEKTSYTPLPDLGKDDQPILNITRLMWREFAYNIK